MAEEMYFTFMLGEGNFALPVENVREVLKVDAITAVPKSLPYLKGVMNIRGSVVTVVDLREMFNFKIETPVEKCSIIVLEVDENEQQPLVLGLLADSVDIVTKLRSVHSENYDFGTMPDRKDFIKKVTKKGDNFILVLDINKIVESIEQEIEKGN